MSHTTEVKMIADQEIEIAGQEVNIHNIKTIYVNANGLITMVALDKYSDTGELLEGVGDFVLVGGYQ